MATTRRNANLPLIAAAVGVLAGAAGIAAWTLAARRAPADGHPAPDLARDTPRPSANDRAPEHFRPDPTAAIPPEDREALRPATGPSPSLVEDRGAVRSLP
ncbi:hypothetical protein COC42_11200 [Sphingomonas spermidinifaciens]|uniref:Uncharacterized protein n=1 Tax=Sphingomonas spermidinifaciens TaxID=1141889 RepID=A0A2A4B253_9SPHN|nr:hypothetical protein [Sphingomonas spermidinifaciens]PCD02045.1 hypothetical protein COC42_11200 [Sphingomonas spermidinifaciens]